MSEHTLRVFISYASYDNQSDVPEERWLDRLLQFLRPLELEAKISSWNDTRLAAGASWRTEIRRAIEKAEVAILLVSPAFLASDFIRTEELPRLLRNANPVDDASVSNDELAEGMLILPILLRPCLIDYVQFEALDGSSNARLSDFQYVPKGTAMNGLSQYDQDKQLESIARRIVEALELDCASTTAEQATNDQEELRNSLLEFLTLHTKWWFNAIRIRGWGSTQRGFKLLGEHSAHQITMELEKLVESQQVLAKPGKKSRVYRVKT